MVSIAGRKKEFYRMLQDWGWFNTGLFAMDKILVRLSKGMLRFYRYYFIAQPVLKTSLLPPGRGKNIDVRPIQETDAVILQFPRPRTTIQARFGQGAKCLVAFKNQEFIGFLWLLLGSYQEDEVRARYTPQPALLAAWDFDVYVAPEYRFGLTFPRLWDQANQLLVENNVAWTCSRISAFNTGSLGAHARLGTIPLGSAIFFCVGRWQISIASIAPYFHLSTHAGSFPEFKLKTQKICVNPSASRDKSTME